MQQDVYWHRKDTDNTTPTKSNATTVEKTHVKAIRSSLDFGKDLCIMFRDAWWQCLATFLSFLWRAAIESGCRNGLEVWILKDYQLEFVVWLGSLHTSLPKLFCLLSPSILLLMYFAIIVVMFAVLLVRKEFGGRCPLWINQRLEDKPQIRKWRRKYQACLVCGLVNQVHW